MPFSITLKWENMDAIGLNLNMINSFIGLMNNANDRLTFSNILCSGFLEPLGIWADKVAGIILDKSTVFDVFKSYQFASANLNKSDRIFFATAYGNHSLQLLSKLGYYRLIGMDCQDDIYNQPNYWKIKFYKGNLTETHLPPNFFRAYFALNIMENLSSPGHDVFSLIPKFLKEAQRIIDNEGFLVMTVMYSEVSTYKNKFTIFDAKDIDHMLSIAEDYGFELVSDMDLNLTDKPLIRDGLEYTIIFLAFKLHKTVSVVSIEEVNVISPMISQDGITIYAENLKRRFKEAGIRVNLVSNYSECNKSCPTIYEYEPSIYHVIPQEDNVYIEAHSTDLRLIRIAYVILKKHSIKHAVLLLSQRRYLRMHSRLIVRSNDLIRKFLPKIRNYYLMPHIAYPDYGIRSHSESLHIGSFGFASPFKNFDKICDLGIRLNVPCSLMLSVNSTSESAREISIWTIQQLKEKYKGYGNIEIKEGFFSDKEILEFLSQCSHIIFAQDDTSQTSGSYRFPVQLGIPVIATDSYQAKESQVIRVNSLDELDTAKLEAIRDKINLDDGFEYLLNIIKYG